MKISLFLKLKNDTEIIDKFVIGYFNNNLFSGITYNSNENFYINERFFFNSKEIILNNNFKNQLNNEFKIDKFNELMNDDFAYTDLEDILIEYISINKTKTKELVWIIYHNIISYNNFNNKKFEKNFSIDNKNNFIEKFC